MEQKEKEELRALFLENLELGRFENCQSLIAEVSINDVLAATEWAKELKDAQDLDADAQFLQDVSEN